MDVVELTKELVKIESVTGSEKEIAEFVASHLDFAEPSMQNVPGFGPNIIAKQVVEADKPILLLNCHLDTVEVMKGWDTDPFEPRIEGNRLFGLGAGDMKAGVAIALEVFKEAWGNRKNIIFTAVSDEEGNSKGSHLLLKNIWDGELEHKGKEILCLIPEDSQETVKLGARGRYVIEIELRGRSAHGATPDLGVNAIEDSARVIDVLQKLPLESHPKLGKGSICVLKINGGGDSLSVPDRCCIRVDRHTVIGEDLQKIKDDFKEILGILNLKSSYEIKLMDRETPFLKPYILDEDSPWASKFRDKYLKVYNRPPEIGYGKSVGDFNAFGQLMPTIVFGPKGENAHGPNECVYVDSVRRCRDMYLEFLKTF